MPKTLKGTAGQTSFYDSQSYVTFSYGMVYCSPGNNLVQNLSNLPSPIFEPDPVFMIFLFRHKVYACFGTIIGHRLTNPLLFISICKIQKSVMTGKSHMKSVIIHT